MSLVLGSSVRVSFALLILLCGSERLVAAAGLPAHIGLTPGKAIVFVGMEQVFTATVYDATYNVAAIEPDCSVGFSTDDTAVANVTIDGSNALLGNLVGSGIGTTTIRTFYIRSGVKTDIVASAEAGVVAGDGTGGSSGRTDEVTCSVPPNGSGAPLPATLVVVAVGGLSAILRRRRRR